MHLPSSKEPAARKPLRLWPGVVLAVILFLARYVVPSLAPDAVFYGGITGMACALAIVIWWLLFSRAPWFERLGALVLMAAGLYAASSLVHVSIRTGMMGMMLPVYAIPVLSLALVAWAAASRRFSAGGRRISMAATILLASGAFTLLRTAGVRGSGAELAWRWSQTPEERLLARAGSEPLALAPVTAAQEATGPVPGAPAGAEPSAPPAVATPEKSAAARAGKPAPPLPAPTAETAAEWPGFRGPGRDGIVPGARIEADWSQHPPVELWRRPVGPGWSSFAIHRDFFYTQEQRGDDEMVSCYKVATGEPVWRHRDAVRFWESNGGAGPRATPTLAGRRLYAFGATGILNALDAGTGAAAWSRDVASDTGVKVPVWGFSSSPLVAGDTVIVAASGTLAAYDTASGKPRWRGTANGGSYSSPHRSTIAGVSQILMLTSAGVRSVAPTDGTLLWQHAWPGVTMVQPALIPDGDVLVSTSGAAGGIGMRRLAVAHGAGGWTVEERWTSAGLKPYFNDSVVHKGHAYGFDGRILACIGLEDGRRNWKGGRYGNGQLVLLPDQDLLLVLSEDGELALVSATPDRFRELARFTAIEGKTWNHPAMIGGILLVRNGEEMAAFRLSRAGG